MVGGKRIICLLILQSMLNIRQTPVVFEGSVFWFRVQTKKTWPKEELSGTWIRIRITSMLPVLRTESDSV